ncbi:hypothetical protein AHAS_Ahas06G0173300 [Arachis hypogaea]|uniref:FAR1 domain-containing protein n=1 Tax=Arachis hypogaea TaxID=3818 RepID=A0A445CQ46_ARAHY|nr:hypothetical protein Ahy_A06g027940 [Arachis hypogaea]RYR53062.1 hypothetical protein Ahy_A06g027941 [Arachis hypogaea]
MDFSFQFSGENEESVPISSEEYYGISFLGGDDDEDDVWNESLTGELGDEIDGNGHSWDLVTCDGGVTGFPSVEDFQGSRHEKHYDHPEKVRTDCKAKLKIYYDAQGHLWNVRRIDHNHNYPLALTMFSHLLPSHQKMGHIGKAQVDSLKKLGIATSRIMAHMASQSGGYRMIRFIKKDICNYVHG